MQDASHEMRTPLAVLKGQLELMSGYAKDTIEEHFEELSQMMSEISGLEKLNNDLLFLSREDVEGKITINKLLLNQFLQAITEYYSDLAELQEKTFEALLPEEDKEVEWDEVKVRRCLTILLENAFKYTKEQDKIKLSIQMSSKTVQIQVEDSGRGIKEEDKERIFDRFFRSSDVRAEGIEGSGIGLSLLKSLTRTLGIKMELQSIYQKGTCFTLEIPLKMQ